MRRLAILSAGLLLAGCGHSPPTRFYTLDAVAPAHAVSAGPRAPVQLSAVHLPPALDRPQVVTQIGPNRLHVSEQDQWGAPLDDMMRRTLAQDLLARLPAGDFVSPEAPRPTGARGLVVDVVQLQATPDRVVLQANWTLTGGASGDVELSRTEQLSVELGAPAKGRDAGAQADAISRLLGELSDRIAAALAAR
jgi:uncharacterized lipoprotein YmbA